MQLQLEFTTTPFILYLLRFCSVKLTLIETTTFICINRQLFSIDACLKTAGIRRSATFNLCVPPNPWRLASHNFRSPKPWPHPIHLLLDVDTCSLSITRSTAKMLERSRRNTLNFLNSRYIYGRLVSAVIMSMSSWLTSAASTSRYHIPDRDGVSRPINREVQFVL